MLDIYTKIVLDFFKNFFRFIADFGFLRFYENLKNSRVTSYKRDYDSFGVIWTTGKSRQIFCRKVPVFRWITGSTQKKSEYLLRIEYCNTCNAFKLFCWAALWSAVHPSRARKSRCAPPLMRAAKTGAGSFNVVANVSGVSANINKIYFFHKTKLPQ